MTTQIDLGPNGLDGATHPDQLSRPLYGSTFGQAIKRFFKGYVRFSGRASRSEYWWAQLALFLLALPGSIVYGIGYSKLLAYLMDSGSAYSAAGDAPYAIALVGIIMLALFSLAIMLPAWALHWRRFHDANYAGPLALLNLIPYLGSIVVIILASMPSKPQGRRYDVL